MKIHEISIKRPVTVLMCVLIVLLLGAVSFTRIPIDLIPEMNLPIAIVSTSYQGVGPQEVESIVTKNIENAIATVSNIKSIQSTSSEGSSIVVAEFNHGTDMDFAALQMREKIDMVRKFLPAEVESPMVIKIDPNMLPIVSLGITGAMNDIELRNYVEDKIKPILESLNGVASVSLSGGKTREIKVELDPVRVSGYGVTYNQVIALLQSENLNQPAGVVEYGEKSLLVRSTGEFQSIDDIRNLPITLPTGTVIYLRDIAEVKDGFKEITTYTRMNGKSSIGLSIQKQTGSNTVEVVNLVKGKIKELEKQNADISIELVFDQGKYIEDSISNVSESAVMGALLAVLVLFVFLKNIRTTLIIGTAIPISIIATFVLIYFSGITLNLVSLGGLALGIGMLVDNAIVVLENIYRYRNEGHSKLEAARLGTQEVGGAIMASTLTTVVVFLPIVFTEGFTAEVFKQLAMTVVFSLLASLIVALTVIPAMSSKMLKMVKQHEASRSKILNRLFDAWDTVLDSIDDFYRKVLVWVLKHKKTTAAAVLAVFVLSLLLLPVIGTEYFPAMDQGQFTVDINMGHGALIEETNSLVEQIEKYLSDLPETEKMFVSVGSIGRSMSVRTTESSNRASISVTLVPLEKRNRSTAVIVDEVRKVTDTIPGAEIKVNEVSSTFGGGMGMGGAPISVKISGQDLEQLQDIAEEVQKIVGDTEGTRQVETSVSQGRPEARIYLNRDKAAAYGIGSAQVAASVRTAVEGRVATRYRVDGNEIDVRVQLPDIYKNNYEALKSIKINSPAGAEVLLVDIADIKIEKGPVSITREGQERYVTVTSDIFGRDVGSISSDIEAGIKKLSTPAGYSIKVEGQQEQMRESFEDLGLALVLSVFLVYMIMAAQFESLLHPFVIMFAVPLAYTGSAFGLVITGRTLSVPSFIGVIMLAGIVVNNAIVLIDYVNTLRKRGMSREDAMIKAGPTRLRPILMTTLTTVLGLIPLALGLGEGSEMQAPLATVVIGGLLSSTVLTLVVIPVIYSIFDDLAERFKKIEANEA
ncbi:MAG: efflux RND transporter permease subunit [Bacillota bacterium]